MKKGISLLLSLVMVFGMISSVFVTTYAASVSDLTFELNADGKSYCVADCKESANGTLAIPATYNGLPVTRLRDFAFYGCKNLTSVIIPDSVTSIGDSNDLEGGGVFKDCTNLSSITIPDSVKSIGCYCFYNTAYSNSNSNWENDVLYIGNHLVEARHISGGTHTIKAGTLTIAACAFQWCGSFTSPFKIPDSVVSIGAYAFFDCIGLSSVTIPESVTEIGDNAFGYFWGSGETKVKGFTICGSVGSAAESYAKYNGFVFKENRPLVVCAKPELKSVTNTTSGVKFIWEKVSGAESYTVMRKKGTGSWKAIKSGLKTTNYTDKTAKSGTTYKYTVKAKNEAGFSDYNTQGLTIKCISDPVLKTPTSAKAGITLKWSKVTGAQGYVVYRQTGNGKLTRLATVKGVSKVTYVDKKAKKGTKYTYKLKAYSGKTYSAYSNSKTIKDKY